jgi:polar amino acid transport system substrate-binding protein
MKMRLFCLLAISILFISCTKKIEKINSISLVNGKRICVLPGSAGDIAARKNFPNSEFIVLAGSADAALAVKNKKADAFVFDKSVLIKIAEKNKDLIILDEPVAKLEVAAAVNKGNISLLAKLNEAMSELESKGVLLELRKKWVDTEYREVPLIPSINNEGENGILRMGTCAIYEPFSFQANGVMTGLDIELCRLIGKILGKKIEVIDMAFEGLIPALQSGKIDFALSNFNVTEERKKTISFSIPYIKNDISILVRR